jgi:hypothetical protein
MARLCEAIWPDPLAEAAATLVAHLSELVRLITNLLRSGIGAELVTFVHRKRRPPHHSVRAKP